MTTLNNKEYIRMHSTLNPLYIEIANRLIFAPICKEPTSESNNDAILTIFSHVERYPFYSSLSSHLRKSIHDASKWNRLLQVIEPNEYAARIVLNYITNSLVPLFSTETRHFANQITEFMNSPYGKLEELTQNNNIDSVAQPVSNGTTISSAFLTLYSSFRRTYRAFALLAYIWKIRKLPIRQTTDLYMNELDPNNINTFKLIEPNGIYYFALNNLVRIIVDAITHQNEMYVEPLVAKNPYTNTPFSKTQLFNIYLALRFKGSRIPFFFQHFYDCEFNIYEFRLKHETELRDYGIKQYLASANESTLYNDVYDMLELNKMQNRICVDNGFPKKQFVNAMKPYLELYYLGRYSFSSITRLYANKKLNTHLKKFATINPNYGKKIQSTPTYFFNNPSNVNRDDATISAAQGLLSLSELLPSMNSPPTVQYYTKVNHTFGYSPFYYMKTHILEDDETFERYVESGDSFETYTDIFPIEREEENPRTFIPMPYPRPEDAEVESDTDDDEDIIVEDTDTDDAEENATPYPPFEYNSEDSFDDEESQDGSIS